MSDKWPITTYQHTLIAGFDTLIFCPVSNDKISLNLTVLLKILSPISYIYYCNYADISVYYGVYYPVFYIVISSSSNFYYDSLTTYNT